MLEETDLQPGDTNVSEQRTLSHCQAGEIMMLPKLHG